MSIENVTKALQAFATTGNGLTLTLPDARFVTFKVQGNGNVTAGAVILECCPQNTPIAPGSGSAGAMVWTTLTTISVPANATVEYAPGWVSGTLRARISPPVTGGTVTVLAIRPEEQRGWSRRPSSAAAIG
jgi:hypothetical protein